LWLSCWGVAVSFLFYMSFTVTTISFGFKFLLDLSFLLRKETKSIVRTSSENYVFALSNENTYFAVFCGNFLRKWSKIATRTSRLLFEPWFLEQFKYFCQILKKVKCVLYIYTNLAFFRIWEKYESLRMLECFHRWNKSTFDVFSRFFIFAFITRKTE
jgi:hypothetical protein